jgi:hypothetical protein
LKNNLKQKRAGKGDVIEHLPSKLEALSSNPSTAKKKKNSPTNRASKNMKQKPTEFVMTLEIRKTERNTQ